MYIVVGWLYVHCSEVALCTLVWGGSMYIGVGWLYVHYCEVCLCIIGVIKYAVF